MSGVTNTGVVNHISNPITIFPANSITVDIFGNAFYRSYEFGAGDDTGVYWNENRVFSREQMLFFAATMERAVLGKYSFGNKLRSSQSLMIKMWLPSLSDGTPDYDMIDAFIRSIEKLVILDEIEKRFSEITAIKQVIGEVEFDGTRCAVAPEEDESFRLAADENGE